MTKIERDNEYHARITFERLRGNGLVFARRETLRMANKLHIDAVFGICHDTVEIWLYSRKDENRLAELWKYVSGRRFQRRILNNGWWG